MTTWADHVHFPAGFRPAGDKVRAVCHCGELTSPRVDQVHALLALSDEHGWTRPSCVRCGRDRTPPGASFDELHRDLQVATDVAGHLGEVLVCADTQQCHVRAASPAVEKVLFPRSAVRRRAAAGPSEPLGGEGTVVPVSRARRHLRIVPNLDS